MVNFIYENNILDIHQFYDLSLKNRKKGLLNAESLSLLNTYKDIQHVYDINNDYRVALVNLFYRLYLLMNLNNFEECFDNKNGATLGIVGNTDVLMSYVLKYLPKFSISDNLEIIYDCKEYILFNNGITIQWRKPQNISFNDNRYMSKNLIYCIIDNIYNVKILDLVNTILRDNYNRFQDKTLVGSYFLIDKFYSDLNCIDQNLLIKRCTKILNGSIE